MAFESSQHSLLRNIRTVQDSSWGQPPEGANRSIRDIVGHVGMFKYMYANHGFRDAGMDYSDPPASPGPERLADPARAIEWLRERRICT